MNVFRAHDRAKADLRQNVEPVASPCPNDPNCTKQLELAGFRVAPDPVAPRGRLAVDVFLRNHALLIDPFDADRCGNSAVCEQASTVEDGYCAQVIAQGDWGGTVDAVRCVQVGDESPPGEKVVRLIMEAPELPEGSQTEIYTVGVIHELMETGEQSAGLSTTFTVSQSGDPGDDLPEPGKPGPGTGPLLPCWLDPNANCTGPETVGWTLGGAFVLMMLMQVVLD